MMNLEVTGMVGLIDVVEDKNTKSPVMSIALMDERGKPFSARVLSVNDDLLKLKRGQEVYLRFEYVEMVMIEFGKWTLRSQTVRLAAAPAVKASA